MFSGGRLTWVTSDQGLLALLAQNRLRDTLLVAAIVFCETGLVGTAFLPGDRSLFATGALLELSPVPPLVPILILAAAAILGDTLHFSIGRSRLGGQMTCTKNYMSWFLLAIVVSLPPVLVQVKRGRAASNP